MRCVEGALGLGGHVVIGVGRVVVHRHHADAIPSVESFLLVVAVHFCTCSQTVFCDRQFSFVAIYCTLLHRENGSFEVLSSQKVQKTVEAPRMWYTNTIVDMLEMKRQVPTTQTNRRRTSGGKRTTIWTHLSGLSATWRSYA